MCRLSSVLCLEVRQIILGLNATFLGNRGESRGRRSNVSLKCRGTEVGRDPEQPALPLPLKAEVEK